MSTELIVPMSLTMSLLAYILIARWYLLPWLNAHTRREALTPILLFHSFRHIGMAFLIVGVTAQPLDPRFAEPAAYGDLLAALLALVALWALRSRWAVALPLVWIFNIVGTVDLLNAVYQGLQFIPNGDLGATYFIPIVIVPTLLVTHYLVFRLLLQRDDVVQPTAVLTTT